MKYKKKYGWLILLAIVIIAGLYAYREYNRKPADLSTVDSQIKISADGLVIKFEKDEQKANLLYLGKPIEVTGLIAEINNQQDTLVTIALGKKEDMHKVSCLLDANHTNEIKRYKVGDNIMLRGICNGYLLDVELNRCVIIK